MPGIDPYLERLLAIQAETRGVDMRLSALESGYALESKSVDAFVKSQIAAHPARYEDFLTTDELQVIVRRHLEALNRDVDCDALDYALAATCGVVSGFLDVFFVGSPSNDVATGAAGDASDKLFDAAIVKFARTLKDDNGGPFWHPRAGNESNPASAKGALERYFRVGYDQATSASIDGLVERVSMSNHHAKSLAHYPDIIGLVASISNQFTNTSSFIDSKKGEIVFTTGTDGNTELVGTTLTSKVFAGAVNWFGHCMSDVAGSSGSKGRGAGLPIPLTEFFQLCNFGRFPNEKGQWQSLATVMTKVYEQGYDLRHGVAASFPVVVNDLLVRAVFTVKRRYVDAVPWSQCLPKADNQEMQRMLTVSVGSMCLVDLGHAAVASWGSWVKFFCDLNLAAWARFGLQGANELEMAANRETLNLVTTSQEIADEWERLLARSKELLT